MASSENQNVVDEFNESSEIGNFTSVAGIENESLITKVVESLRT